MLPEKISTRNWHIITKCFTSSCFWSLLLVLVRREGTHNWTKDPLARLDKAPWHCEPFPRERNKTPKVVKDHEKPTETMKTQGKP